MTTPLAFAGKMKTIATALPNQTLPLGVLTAAKYVKGVIEAGAPSVLRNVGKGARVGAKVLPADKTGNGVEVLVAARGPFQLIERPIAAHTIEPRAFGAAVNNPLVIPGSATGFAAYAKHPGVHRSSGPFERGVRLARPEVPRIIDKVAVDALLRAVI